MLFGTFSLLAWKIHCSLHSLKNKKKNTINGPAKTGENRSLSPALCYNIIRWVHFKAIQKVVRPLVVKHVGYINWDWFCADCSIRVSWPFEKFQLLSYALVFLVVLLVTLFKDNKGMAVCCFSVTVLSQSALYIMQLFLSQLKSTTRESEWL